MDAQLLVWPSSGSTCSVLCFAAGRDIFPLPAQPVHITYIYYSFESVTIEYEIEMAWEEYEYVQILYYIIDGIVPYFMFYLSAH